MLSVKEADSYVTCPYNKSHQILANRMQTHLVKCKKQHPNAKMAQCMFNTIHRIPEPELHYHHSVCPDRRVLEQEVFAPQCSSSAAPKIEVPVFNIQATEEWEDENLKTYNPQEYCKKNQIIHSVRVEPKAVRKLHRMEEREKHQQFANEAAPPKIIKIEEPVIPHREPEAFRNARPDLELEDDTPREVADLLKNIKRNNRKTVIPSSSKFL